MKRYIQTVMEWNLYSQGPFSGIHVAMLPAEVGKSCLVEKAEILIREGGRQEAYLELKFAADGWIDATNNVLNARMNKAEAQKGELIRRWKIDHYEWGHVLWIEFRITRNQRACKAAINFFRYVVVELLGAPSLFVEAPRVIQETFVKPPFAVTWMPYGDWLHQRYF